MRIDAALREDPAETTDDTGVLINIEQHTRINRPTTKAASFDEPQRRHRVAIAGTHSSNNIAGSARSHEAKQQNRRSWAGVLSTSRSARQILEEIRSAQPISYQAIQEAQNREERTNPNTNTLFYSKELSPTCSRDPFGGRAQTTPTDEPPTYEEALKLPALRKLTRSITGTDFSGPRRAFLRDVLANRRSCLEGVGILSDAKVVRLPFSEGDETPL